MTIDELSDIVIDPNVLNTILGSFNKAFSLGVSGVNTLLLSVPSGTTHVFPDHIWIKDERVSIEVDDQFVPPSI